jgi:hypothetical protein
MPLPPYHHQSQAPHGENMAALETALLFVTNLNVDDADSDPFSLYFKQMNPATCDVI